MSKKTKLGSFHHNQSTCSERYRGGHIFGSGLSKRTTSLSVSITWKKGAVEVYHKSFGPVSIPHPSQRFWFSDKQKYTYSNSFVILLCTKILQPTTIQLSMTFLQFFSPNILPQCSHSLGVIWAKGILQNGMQSNSLVKKNIGHVQQECLLIWSYFSDTILVSWINPVSV